MPFLTNKLSVDDSLATLANTTHAKQVIPTKQNPPETTSLTKNVDPHHPRTTLSNNSSQSRNPSDDNNQNILHNFNPTRSTNSPHITNQSHEVNPPTTTSKTRNTLSTKLPPNINPPRNTNPTNERNLTLNTKRTPNTDSSCKTNPTHKTTHPKQDTKPPTTTHSSRKTNSNHTTTTPTPGIKALVPARQSRSNQPDFPPDNFVGDRVFRYGVHYWDIKIDHSNCPGDDSCLFYIGVISHVNACTITFHGFVKSDCSEDLSLELDMFDDSLTVDASWLHEPAEFDVHLSRLSPYLHLSCETCIIHVMDADFHWHFQQH